MVRKQYVDFSFLENTFNNSQSLIAMKMLVKMTQSTLAITIFGEKLYKHCYTYKNVFFQFSMLFELCFTLSVLPLRVCGLLFKISTAMQVIHKI